MILFLSSAGPFEFLIPASNELTLLPQTRIQGVCKIVRKDGTDLPIDTDFSVVNLFPHSIFSQVDLEIDGVNLSCQDNLYPYKAYLETLLTFGLDSKGSHLTTSHYAKDTAHHFNDFDDKNKGYIERKKDVSGSKSFDFCISPHIDFLHTPKVLPSGVQMKMKLSRSNDSFSILSKTDEDLHLKIENLTLFVYRMQPSESLRQLQDRMFMKNNALFPITRSLCKKYTIPAGLSSANTPNIIHGVLPRQIVIGFVRADALNGAYNLNPFNFQHFDLNFLALRINGVQTPGKGYRPNFQKKIVRREVRALYDNIGINSPADDAGCDINVDDFTGGYTLFAFDLTSDMCNGYHIHEHVSGNIDCEVLFSKPLTHAITVICYIAYESIVGITKDRSIIITP